MAGGRSPDLPISAPAPDDDPRRSALVAVALRMRLEAAAVELVDALRAIGIVPLLLKGPAIAGWLYGPLGERREYQDLGGPEREDLRIPQFCTRDRRTALGLNRRQSRLAPLG